VREGRRLQVRFSYLDRQFADIDGYLDDVRALVRSGEFTLGSAVEEFERRFAELSGMRHAVGVGTGTDAISMPLRLLDVGPGDEVVTTPNTFIATVGAIVATGARPVFVDSEDGFVIDPEGIEAAITPRTKAIVPVHYTGNVADMPAIAEIAQRRGLVLVEDACQATAASIDGKPVGSWGEAAAFSLHPLKNLNVWGDGGIVVTRNDLLADRLRLYRNHGLVGRDEVATWGVNSRLDALQAVIGNRLIGSVQAITERRIANAERYDSALAGLPEIRVPARRPGVRHVFHLYMVRAERRDELLRHLNQHGVEAKVHYPIPVHLQEAARELGYGRGSFPNAERDAETVITLPAHPYLTDDEIDFAVEQVRTFYGA
jgi:dTDP-3-amino-2,3,6-trideoxy-4-keto-D-glucose/dTDP-3-amino-3,4,6-trideoxy-alpha-D-glucose/dTDP-2,6-dideoxy-D-kanosamine transaminase